MKYSKKLNEQLVTGAAMVKFTKADGSEREMRCTQYQGLIPFDKMPINVDVQSAVQPPEDLVKVFDMDCNAWRSFKPSRVISWECN